MKTEIKMIPVKLLEQNRGQVSGLPKNPRFFRDYRYEAMVKSMRDCPEMLELRELIVFPNGDKFVTVCGNLRLRGGRELGLKEMPCKVLPADTPVKKLCEYAAKDNISYGEDDMDIISNEWDREMLEGWGFEFPQEKEKDPSRSVSKPSRMMMQCTHSFPSTMNGMSYSSSRAEARLTATGYANGSGCRR